MEQLVLIPAGTFQMGNDYSYNRKIPAHTVTVNSFYIGRYPVTNKEYKLFRASHRGRWSEPDFPVEMVNWYDAIDYCNWFSDRSGLTGCYTGSKYNMTLDINKNGYRLPTEAEWEYACRAGSDTDYYWGYEMNGDYCWYLDNSEHKVHPAGQKKPNNFSLYDMSGNVREWCWDWYNEDYYEVSPSKNPTGPSEGSNRVIRGGCWCYTDRHCQSCFRDHDHPDNPDECGGFRIVRSGQ